jgi:hypothetical protein
MCSMSSTQDLNGCITWLYRDIRCLKDVVQANWQTFYSFDPAADEIVALLKGLFVSLTEDLQIKSSLTRLQRQCKPQIIRDQPIIHELQIRAGFMGMGAMSSLPIHDHPDSFGAVMLLQGQVGVDIFNVQSNERTKNQKTPCIELRRLRNDILRPGDISMIFPYQGNLHRVKSPVQIPSIFLDILVSRTQIGNRNFYFPLDIERKEASCLYASRVSNLSLKTAVTAFSEH